MISILNGTLVSPTSTMTFPAESIDLYLPCTADSNVYVHFVYECQANCLNCDGEIIGTAPHGECPEPFTIYYCCDGEEREYTFDHEPTEEKIAKR